ncbi:molybdenum cofactor biosynthesis protein MoaE [bacterium]|nr:molybdenum cofactor biosynthesis protein MoaE [bacterium]
MTNIDTSFNFEIRKSKIDTQSLSEDLRKDKGLGGIVIFEGRVRNESEGKEVLKLEYESYKELAESEGKKILKEALAKYAQVKNVICIHGEGEMEPGDLAVWVGAASPHRDEAFQACRYVIEAVKHRLPIWKKETFKTGEAHWVNCREHHAIPCN